VTVSRVGVLVETVSGRKAMLNRRLTRAVLAGLLLVSTFAAPAMPSHAQEGWVSLGPNWRGSVDQLAAPSTWRRDGVMLVMTSELGLMRTRDGGQTWQ
jgi:hypothetical protein